MAVAALFSVKDGLGDFLSGQKSLVARWLNGKWTRRVKNLNADSGGAFESH